MVIRTKVVIGWFKLQFWMCLVDAHYNFECDRLIQLSDNNLENKSFLNEWQSRKLLFSWLVLLSLKQDWK